ncbi:DUF6961 family protein [Sphingomonas sp. UBA978]|jgi:hypothetical protein|uniref:DUF6961 family protein n=1 Tax=Sphingomonas sp. UBA978 TaxID=1947536 RepID=UPI0039C97F44
MATDHELWAIALKVEQDHGGGAPRHIAERIGAAAIAGEWEAVALWKAVAAKYDLLRQGASTRS